MSFTHEYEKVGGRSKLDSESCEARGATKPIKARVARLQFSLALAGRVSTRLPNPSSESRANGT